MALEDQGYRVTGTRRVVAQAVERRPEGFTAEQISDALPEVGRATVFRSLKLFSDVGVICKLNLPDGAPRYAVASGERHHHHAICVECGTVGEFRNSTVERVLRTVAGDIEGEILSHRMEFYIRCPACDARRRG